HLSGCRARRRLQRQVLREVHRRQGWRHGHRPIWMGRRGRLHVVQGPKCRDVHLAHAALRCRILRPCCGGQHKGREQPGHRDLQEDTEPSPSTAAHGTLCHSTSPSFYHVRSCTATLRIIPSPPKPGKIPHLNTCERGTMPWWHIMFSLSSSCSHSFGFLS